MLNKRLKIKEFDASYEYAYRIRFEDLRLPLFVNRNEGSILFGKSSIGANVIDGFKLSQNKGKIELLLHITDDFGAHTNLIGEIDDKDEKIKADAEAWMAKVNKLYENQKE
jgi:hypothetical protein